MISCFAVGVFKFAFRQQLDERFNYWLKSRRLGRDSVHKNELLDSELSFWESRAGTSKKPIETLYRGVRCGEPPA